MTFIKTPMYRRGRGSPNDGLKERALWLLSKGAMTATQLATQFNVPRTTITQMFRNTPPGDSCVAYVTTERTVNADGSADTLYTLSGRVKRVAPKVTPAKGIVISKKSLSDLGEDKKQEAEKAAAARRRLYRRGHYITSGDLLADAGGRE